MPRRALAERRPWLFASLIVAIAYYVLKDADFPGMYLFGMQACSVLMLSVYAVLRHHDVDSRILAGALALAGMGVVAVELDVWLGASILIVANCLAIGLFTRHRRAELGPSQKAAVLALLLLVPLICWRLPLQRKMAELAGLYGLALGGMAAAAWASAFPRYRVGIGALLSVGAGMLGIAGQGTLAHGPLPGLLAWPLFYFGQFLLCIGATQKLRADFLR